MAIGAEANTASKIYGAALQSPPCHEIIDSSAIEAVDYHAARQHLDVELTNRRIYRYFDVPPEVYHALMAADSKGRFCNDDIRDDYECVRLR